ncbi:hypothetical protein HETIRDRAFT_241971, partial [Heterobasidion irregulare TC 32-1]
NPKEDITYATISEFLRLHDEPLGRFIQMPQPKLRWNHTSTCNRREEIPDFVLFNMSLISPHIRLRAGIETKRLLPTMKNLPTSLSLEENVGVMGLLHLMYYQGEDQAKAAVRSEYVSDNVPIPWLLFIGPYWTPVLYGPFTPQELSVRVHKHHPSADFQDSVNAMNKLLGKPQVRPLFLLGTIAARNRLEQFIQETDVLAQPLVEA